MSLAHFKALNADSSEESDGDVENPSVTREALEEKAVSEYTKILFLVRNKQWEEAEEGLKNLLESDVLSRVTGNVNYVAGRLQPSLVHLKYCVLVNLGHVSTELNQIKTAVDYYLEAVNLDDTDLNLWYKIGRAAIKIPNLNLASYSFQEALRCNPNHWPSLDTLVTVLYASGNFLLCLYFISEGLEKDPKFLKGVAFGRKIFDEHPSFKRDFPLYYPQCLLDDKLKQCEEVNMEDEAVVKMFDEANKLKKSFETLQWPRENKDEVLTSVKPERPLRKKSWVTLGRSLLQVYSRLKEEYPEISFYRHVDLSADDDLTEMVVDNEEKEDFLDEQLIDEEVDKINENVTESEETGGRNKRRRSSPSLLEQWMPCSKRRSARVRSTVRKDEPTLARTLHNLLPQKLRPLKDDRKDRDHLRYSEDSMDTMDMYRLFEIRDGTSVLQESNDHFVITNNTSDDERSRLIDGENYFNKDREVNDVSVFIKENNCSNILTLLNNYVRSVSSLWKLWWPSCLNTVYLKIYKIIRLHSPENCQNSESLDFTAALSVLLYGELLLDYWLQKGKEQGLPSPITGSVFGGEFCTLSFGDLNYVCDDSEDSEFIIRCYWLEALMYLHAGNTQSTLIVLQKYMSDERCDNVEVKLFNVKNHYVVNTDLIERLYNTLLRNKSLDEVKKLFNEKKYEKVSEILFEALQPTARLLTADFVEPVVDRCTQFSLLLDSLLELERYNDCFVWCELCCHEAMNNCRNGLEDTEGCKSKWLVLLANGLQALPYCIDQGGSDIFSNLPDNKLIRLIQTLSSVVCHQIDSSDGTDIPFETISPWILLYEILKHHEITSGKHIEDDEIPNSLTLLFTAHEYLGRRSWCLNDDAEILFKTLTVLLPIMESSNPDSDKMLILNQQMEQIFYCLYGHPVKRNRPRYVQDHNVDSLPLTWPRSQLVYKFLKPRELPMYDSSARYSISQDVEILFREIVSLIPTENNSMGLIEKLNSYIEGTSNELPLNKSVLPVEIVDIYYLIADYHFKNKLWSKAIKYYILDVCANPNRVDSWACLALARGSQLETKLNSCEPIKNESDFLKRAKMSCRCYQRSLQLDPEQSTLWIEYGSFSYMVHSFCSRLLIQEQNLSLELFEILETQKDEMLETAFKCFTSANMLWTRFEKMGVEPEIQDERWLHHYMLGKISEKKEDKPLVYLNHFVKSIKFLHLNNAKYPEHISYSNPQHYSVEALELYYRVHACILKSLEQSEDQPISKDLRRFFFEILEKSACGPFANFGEFVDLGYKTDGNNEKEKDYYYDIDIENADDTPLVEKEVKYVLNNILTEISGQDDGFSCKRKLSFDESEDVDESNYKKIKTEEEGSDLECKINSDNAKVLLSQKSKDSDSGNDSKNEMSDDRSQDSKKVLKKVKSQDSSSETLSDSDTSSSDSDSSEDSSSSDESDSSSSDSSQQDSSDEDKPPPAKKLKMTDSDMSNWKEEQRCLIDRCLCAMEECVRRFPEHYKSIYRQAHYYFRSKVRSDTTRVRKLLLGEGGLFADRKVNHFFNGVWRIPSSEIDRPGSFAGHMSRCLHLLLDLLRDSRDHRMLFTLSLQLKDTPEPDKKYLRDEEREQLAKESVTLSVQAFRRKLYEAHTTSEILNILNEAYKYYRRINKLWPQRDSAYVGLVTQCFTRYLKSRGENNCKCTFEAAVKFCQDGTLIAIPPPAPIVSAPAPEPVPSPSQKPPQSQQQTEVVNTTVSSVMTSSTALPSSTSASVTTTSTVSSSPNNATSAAASVTSSPVIKAVQPPSTPPTIPIKRPRGRPAGSSVRHPNPLSQMLKNFPGMSKDLQMLYKNFPYSPQQLMSVMRTNPMLAMQAASLSVQQQFSTVQAEILRQMNIVPGSQKQPTSSPLSTSSCSKSNIMPSSSLSPLTTAPKDHPNLTITAVPSSTKCTSSASNSQAQRSGTKSLGSKSNVKTQLSATAKQVNKLRDAMGILSVPKSPLPPVAKSPVPSVSKSLMPSVSKSPVPPVSKKPMLCSPPIIKNQTPNLPFNPVIPPASVRHPMTPNMPIGGGISGSDMSLQHKLLSAKRNKQPSLSQKKEADLPNMRYEKDLSVQSANKNLIDMSKSSCDNKFRGMSGPGGLSISKFQSKAGGSSEQPKQLPKDLALSVSTVNNDLSTKLSSLSPKEITLTRLTQNIGGDNVITTSTANSISSANNKTDKVTVSFMENINKNKMKQLNLPERQQDLAQIQQMATNLTSNYRKQMPTVVDNRISALKAIGTQLTITSTASGPSTNDNKKQDTIVNYDKAEVTIVPPKEKQKKDSCEIIFLE